MFVLGVGYQYGNDGLFGAPQPLVKEFVGINPDEYGGRSFQAGRILGSAIVMVQGAIEFLAGLGGGGVGLATTPVGVGAVITPASAAVAAVGAGHTASGFKGLQDSIRAFFSQETKGTGQAKLNPTVDKQKKGTPGNNQAQNKQVNDIVNKHKLTKEQRRELHDEISGQNYSYKEIEEIARDIKNGN